MIKTEQEPISVTAMTTVTATPAAPAAPAAPAVPEADPPPAVSEPEERSVNLAGRFFNVKTGLSFLLGITILIILLRVTAIHPTEIWEQLQQVDGRVYALAFLSYLLTFPSRGLRWQRLLSNVGSHVPLMPLTEVIFISWFVNSVLPGKVGDLYRGYLLRREYGLSLSRTMGTVVAERVVDLASLISLLGLTGFLVLRNRVSPLIDQMLHAGWIGLAVLLVGMVVIYHYGQRMVTIFPEPVQLVYRRFAHGAFSSLKNPPVLAGLTILAWGAEAARLYFVMQAMHVSLGPLVALFTVAAISLALIVPTPGGLGGVEAAFAGVLTVFGVPVQLALAVGLLDRVISFYGVIIFGLPAFLLTRRGKGQQVVIKE